MDKHPYRDNLADFWFIIGVLTVSLIMIGFGIYDSNRKIIELNHKIDTDIRLMKAIKDSITNDKRAD